MANKSCLNVIVCLSSLPPRSLSGSFTCFLALDLGLESFCPFLRRDFAVCCFSKSMDRNGFVNFFCVCAEPMRKIFSLCFIIIVINLFEI